MFWPWIPPWPAGAALPEGGARSSVALFCANAGRYASSVRPSRSARMAGLSIDFVVLVLELGARLQLLVPARAVARLPSAHGEHGRRPLESRRVGPHATLQRLGLFGAGHQR